MNLRSQSLLFALFFSAACASSKPATPPPPVNPVTDPTIIGAVDETDVEGSIAGEEGAKTGRRIGRVAGVFAAVLGGPQVDSVEGMAARYRLTRDTAEAIGAAVAGSKGAAAGARRGLDLDIEFADLHAVTGLDVTRPYPDQIDIRLLDEPSAELMSSLNAIFAKHEARSITIEGSDGPVREMATAFQAGGVAPSNLTTYVRPELVGVVVHLRYSAGRGASGKP